MQHLFVMLLWSLLPEHLPSRLAVVVLSELYDILFWTIPVCSFLPKDRVQPYGSNYGVCSAIPTPITLWIAHMVKFPCNSLTINGLFVCTCLFIVANPVWHNWQMFDFLCHLLYNVCPQKLVLLQRNFSCEMLVKRICFISPYLN